MCFGKNFTAENFRDNRRRVFAARIVVGQINGELWVIEEDVRECEKAKDFGETFIELARAVYIANDRRAQEKKINVLLGSALIEEKSYADYQSRDMKD